MGEKPGRGTRRHIPVETACAIRAAVESCSPSTLAPTGHQSAAGELLFRQAINARPAQMETWPEIDLISSSHHCSRSEHLKGDYQIIHLISDNASAN